jgi:hypothetical protein
MDSAMDNSALTVEYENVVHAPYTDSLTGLFNKAMSSEESLAVLNQMVEDGKLDADLVGNLTAIITGQ